MTIEGGSSCVEMAEDLIEHSLVLYLRTSAKLKSFIPLFFGCTKSCNELFFWNMCRSFWIKYSFIISSISYLLSFTHCDSYGDIREDSYEVSSEVDPKSIHDDLCRIIVGLHSTCLRIRSAKWPCIPKGLALLSLSSTSARLIYGRRVPNGDMGSSKDLSYYHGRIMSSECYWDI